MFQPIAGPPDQESKAKDIPRLDYSAIQRDESAPSRMIPAWTWPLVVIEGAMLLCLVLTLGGYLVYAPGITFLWFGYVVCRMVGMHYGLSERNRWANAVSGGIMVCLGISVGIRGWAYTELSPLIFAVVTCTMAIAHFVLLVGNAKGSGVSEPRRGA